MPRYYFHIDGNRPHEDDLGEELANDHLAWGSAIKMMHDLDSGFHAGHPWRLEVCREKTPLYHITVQSRHLIPAARENQHRPPLKSN